MNEAILKQTAKSLVAEGHGILAADESTSTIQKRLAAINVESNPETNRLYRRILFTTPDIEKYISGIILYDETIHQADDNGIPFPKLLADKGILPGIKVDKGAKDMANFPNEKITEGLDELRERLLEYVNLGARFTKWRAVITIGDNIPTDTCIYSNAECLARYAALSQEAGLVPIVEPEVLMDGNHDIERCAEVTKRTLKAVFQHLENHKIYLPGILLKPNMIVPGKDNPSKASPEVVAEKTLQILRDTVPGDVPGVVFLSGGQTPRESTEALNEMNMKGPHPWEVAFSFARALQEPVMNTWMGKPENIEVAQKAFLKRARLNSLARSGKYKEDMEANENGS